MAAPDLTVIHDDALLELDQRATACLDACEVAAAEYPHLPMLRVAAVEAFEVASTISGEISRRLAVEIADFLGGVA